MLRKHEIRNAETEAIKAVYEACKWLRRFDLPRDIDIAHETYDQVSDALLGTLSSRIYQVDIRDEEIEGFRVEVVYTRGDELWHPHRVTVFRKQEKDLILHFSHSSCEGIRVVRASTPTSSAA